MTRKFVAEQIEFMEKIMVDPGVLANILLDFISNNTEDIEVELQDNVDGDYAYDVEVSIDISKEESTLILKVDYEEDDVEEPDAGVESFKVVVTRL